MKSFLLFSLLLAGASGLHAASAALPRSTPEAQGVSSAAIADFIRAADAKVDTMHSFMLVRHGQVISEAWWTPYDATTPHTLYSLSKSFTSTAVGLAVAEGKLSIDDPVIKFFPDELPAVISDNLKAMRVRDLLTMSTGHHNEDIAAFPFQSAESLPKKFLSLPVAHKPGTLFVYNTPATYMQSAIVQKVTGQSVLEYLRPRLFEPLGIENPQWLADAHGISLGGYGLSARTEEIARFGQLYLQKGQWQGRQILPASWIEMATSRQVSNGSSPDSDWDQGYGFQFWRCRHGFYRGDGAFGQYCIVMPELDAVVAITSGTRDMQRVMNLIWDQLVPAMKAEALPEDRSATDRLGGLVRSLSIPAPTAVAGAGPSSAMNRIYRFPTNPTQLETLALADGPVAGSFRLTMVTAGKSQEFDFTPGKWLRSRQPVGQQPEQDVAISGSWTGDDTLTVKFCFVETPLIVTTQLRFVGSTVFLDSEYNVSFGPPQQPQLIGYAP